MDEAERQRELNRIRMERYRRNKTTISITTTKEVKDALYQMAEEQGYATFKEFIEALAKGYEKIEK